MIEWSQEDLSKRIGVSRRALAIYESGGSTLKEENILQLIDIFQQAGVTFTTADHGALVVCISEEAVMEGRLRKRELRR